MKAFRNGERDFKQNEIVYVIDNDGLNSLFSISFGMIDIYAGFDKYYVDLYTVSDNEGILDPDFKFSIYDENSISEGIRKGFFVPRLCIKNYSKIHPDCPQYVVTHKSNIFRTGKEVFKEFNRRKQKKESESKRRSSMTEYQLCREDNTTYLKRVGLTEEEVSECLNLIDTSSYLPNMEDIDIRRFGDNIEWKSGQKWEIFMHLNRPKEKEYTEKYYVDVYHVWDLDKTPVFRGFTNESPESIFQKYGDCKEYVMGIGNRSWSIEKSLIIPNSYKSGVTTGEDGNLTPILITIYTTEHGYFELVDGKLRHFDISIDYKHNINNFWISIFSKTKLDDQEIREWFSKRIGNVTGEFEELFKEKINELDIKRW